jgi:polyhydroxyalkanoate synthesis regulator protein
MSKQNIAMIERAMRMFTPFGAPGAAGAGEMKPQAAPTPMGQPVQVSDLKRQLDALQAQIERLNPGSKADKA